MIHAGLAWLIALLACIRDDYRKVGEHNGPGDKHPTGPPWNEDGQDHTSGADPHRYEIPPGATGLFDTQAALGLGDREDIT